jgi:AmmeMemoRadiSam system protein B
MGSAASTSPPFYIRRAHHAGSWYDDTSSILNQSLQRYLDQVVLVKETADTTASSEQNDDGKSSRRRCAALRGLIVPHAGYSYSGPTAAYAYHALREELLATTSNPTPSPIRHILVLHPSHHAYLDNCVVSGAQEIQTPLGSLSIANDLRQEILALSTSSHPFTIMNQTTDENEHSGEMQYPYICKILQDTHRLGNAPSSVSVLPIMCGALNPSQEEEYGKILAPIIARLDVLTVVSTDFCHWGQRFRYQPTSSGKEIFEHIQAMDRQGMDHIELQQPGAFVKYLQQTRNTICGRHAIAVWLHAVRYNREMGRQQLTIDFIHYEQSSAAKSMQDSSVSYASAVARLDDNTK